MFYIPESGMQKRTSKVRIVEMHGGSVLFCRFRLGIYTSDLSGFIAASALIPVIAGFWASFIPALSA